MKTKKTIRARTQTEYGLLSCKRSQTEIIVTVLLVLVALAAVGFIAYFIMGQVRGGTAEAEAKADCLKTLGSYTIVKVTNASTGNLQVKKETDDGIVLKEFRVYVNDKSNTVITSIPDALETKNINLSGLKVGESIKMYPVLNSTGTLCEQSIISGTVIAA